MKLIDKAKGMWAGREHKAEQRATQRAAGEIHGEATEATHEEDEGTGPEKGSSTWWAH